MSLSLVLSLAHYLSLFFLFCFSLSSALSNVSLSYLFSFSVPPQPPRISGLDEGALREGEEVNVTCESHGGNPLADLVWYRGFDKVSCHVYGIALKYTRLLNVKC